ARSAGAMSPGMMMVLVLVAATLPAVVRQLYPPMPLPRTQRPPRCVVVLGGGLIRRGGQWHSSAMGVRRLQRALEQARQRQLPLLISGGGAGVSRGAPGEAALLAELAQGYGVTLWVEDRSRNTRENARNSAALLVRKGIDS